MLKTSLGMTTLKTSFSNCPWIYFCLDADNWAFEYFLVNVSSLSITILACYRCILDCLWLCLAGDKGAKSIDKRSYIIATSIRSTYARDISIVSICVVGTWISSLGIGGARTQYICARDAFAWGVEPGALIGSKVTLAGPKINDCGFLSFMGYIFASTEEVSYWGGWKCWSSRSNHTFDIRYIFLYLQKLFLNPILSCLLMKKLTRRWFIWLLSLLI